MKHEDYDFDTFSQEKLQVLENIKDMVLSTCVGSRVTSRVVSTACRGTKILFASFGHNTKCVQIRENPEVALCFDTIQIEGVATIKGSPQDESNTEGMALYQEKQPPAYYSSVMKSKGMVLIEVEIKRIAVYKMNTWFIDRIDFEKHTAFRDSIEKD